ncbi:hypothetical protein [Micromonospora costi]|nr:hypothetical protein [Micromonospora costi]
MAGYDSGERQQVYNAVYPVLAEPARVRLRRRAAGPQDPGIDYTDQEA